MAVHARQPDFVLEDHVHRLVGVEGVEPTTVAALLAGVEPAA